MASGRLSWPAKLVIIGIAIFALYFSWLSLRKAEVYDWYSSDLGNMWQTVWNVGHGHGFQFTHTGLGYDVPRLSIHSDYLLLALAPLSWLPFGAASLLVLQAVVVAFGAWFVFRIGQAWLGRDDWAAWAAMLYLFFGPLQFAVVWQFHAVTLAVTFLLAMAEAIILKRRAWIFWLWFGLALITKEQVGLIAGLMAGALWWAKGDRRLAWWSLGLGWVYAVIQLALVIPAFRPGQSPNLFWDFYFGDLGKSPSDKVGHLLQPATLAKRLLNQNILQNFLVLILPLAGLTLASGWIVIAAIGVLPHWLAGAESVTSLYFHNHVLAIPPLLLGTIAGWARLNQWLSRFQPRLERYWPILIGFWLVIGSIAFSPNAWSLKGNPHFLLRDPELHRFIGQTKRIPAQAELAYSLGLGQYVRNRPEAFLLPFGIDQADYVALYQPKPFSDESGSAERRRIQLIKLQTYFDQSPAFRVLLHDGRGTIYQRIKSQTPEPLPASLFVPNPDLPASGTAQPAD